MSFQGNKPFGTDGGDDEYTLPQTPPDIRLAEGRTYLFFLRINGPLHDLQRENIEDVVRILDSRGEVFVAIIVREAGTVIDAGAVDIDFLEVINAESISPGVVQLSFKTLSITTDMLAAASVTLAKMAAGSIDTAQIIDLAVTGPKIAANAITTDKISDGTIVNADINAAAAIAGSKIASGGITSTQIADGTIVNADINAAAAIAGSKLADLSVADIKLEEDYILDASNVIVSSHIQTGAITNTKLASNAVTSDKISDGTIVDADINAAAAIAGSKIATGGITSTQIADGTIVNADINAAAAIVLSKLAELPGSIALAEIDFTTQSSVILESVFTSAYEHYLLHVSLDAISSSGAVPGIRFRVAGIGDDSGASNYATMLMRHLASSSTFLAAGSLATYCQIGPDLFTSPHLNYAAFIMSPQISSRESVVIGLEHCVNSGGASLMGIFGGQRVTPKTHDGLTLFITAGTMTGRMTLHAFKDV